MPYWWMTHNVSGRFIVRENLNDIFTVLRRVRMDKEHGVRLRWTERSSALGTELDGRLNANMIPV